MKTRKILIIVAVVLVAIIIGVAILQLIRANNKKNVADVMSYNQEKKNPEEETVENNSLLDEEQIVVVLPNEEKPEEPEEQNNENKPNQSEVTTSNKKYYIKVNNQANVVTIYKKDSQGNYTVPVKAMICSTGKATPKSGTYPIQYRWEWLGLVGNVYGYYSTQIVGDILFHSVPYLKKYDPSSLEYWEYDKLGTSCSAGCIRLKVEDAKWIFNNVEKGTLVEFYYSSNPGPLGKPSAQKISGNVDCRDWDPTDSNPQNPWHTYKELTPEDNNVVENVTTNNEIVNNNTTTENEVTNTNTVENEIIDNTTTENEIENNTTIENTTSNNTITDNEIIENNLDTATE